MLLGDKHKFAIESNVSIFLDSKSQMAIGYFNIHIKSIRYGVLKSDASILGSSFYEVKRRIELIGKHTLSKKINAYEAILAYQYENYGIGKGLGDSSVYTDREILDEFIKNKIVWAPDGDAAFDDGGHVFQIDEGENVRLIGFINGDPVKNISEIRIRRNKFYNTIKEWSDLFYEEWCKNKGTVNLTDTC